MTQDPDGTNPDDPGEGPTSDGGRKLDEDAAWLEIVEHYGDRANLGDDTPPVAEPSARVESVETPPAVVEPRWQDPLDTEATWNEEGHFVPPVPPPLPPLEPRRKFAWIGLFGSPVLMLAAVVFGFRYPGWVIGALVIGFVGGFGYLVATMPRNRPDGWSGDDGAVV